MDSKKESGNKSDINDELELKQVKETFPSYMFLPSPLPTSRPQLLSVTTLEPTESTSFTPEKPDVDDDISVLCLDSPSPVAEEINTDCDSAIENDLTLVNTITVKDEVVTVENCPEKVDEIPPPSDTPPLNTMPSVEPNMIQTESKPTDVPESVPLVESNQPESHAVNLEPVSEITESAPVKTAPSKVFTAPDGTAFPSKSLWRDYMVQTYYSFKNKVNTESPLVKQPGEVNGQSFDISDCSQSTLVVMDVCEQVQIDEVHNCRIFIGACASSIFIRNCFNCVFYTCCRQLRLREVTKCDFYIYSMSEVHIEYSSCLRFAPFNGGYPEQLEHFQAANMDVNHNLWYDIYDHNDPTKSHANWCLLPAEECEAKWFPAGLSCDLAVPVTLPGGVTRHCDVGIQSFEIIGRESTNDVCGKDGSNDNLPIESVDTLQQDSTDEQLGLQLPAPSIAAELPLAVVLEMLTTPLE